ncbi:MULTISPECIES: GNAT family N-acetyltransferase [Arthrobacter]|uniref:GNAT family N-acetyltransferase n=2 Tax=Arthrobacter TaxID=1663 RepID=A0ABU9KG29_9MICC|nr:GNAT family N-acetyltransferase [Arthrobacter sp. YJM1]MDP5225845.1 GNAT family N-acetyltransferase [Arthrobacter sp. YJM1]
MARGADNAGYPDYWEADVVLRDGGTGHIRPIAPSDAEAVQAFHQAQSQASVYLRFFSYKAKLTGRELKRFTEVDHRDRVALVITIAGEIVGIARYDRLEDPSEAEVAFNISDRHQGRGLGSILLEHLAAAALENGIRRFSAEVLPENRKMLGVFADAGYEVKRQFESGVVLVGFGIDPTVKSRAVMESREHRAEARSVQELLAPRSVAVIGASRHWGKLGYELMHHLREGGFTGVIHAVNPSALEVGGGLSHGTIAEVPGPVDLAVIAVPYEDVLRVVDECGAAGVRGVLVVTAGFADDGEQGLARQIALVRQARASGMRVIGPASLGVVNTDPAVSLNASMAPSLPAPGGLGLFSQSAAVGISLYATAQRRGLGLSSFLSAGNRADVSGNDVMQYWEDDPRTRAVGLFLESFGNPRKFSRIARRLARSKPVIVAKPATIGLRLPPGHAVRTTQAPPAALDAMLRQAGVIRVETMEELLDVAQIIEAQPLPAGRRLGVVANSLSLSRIAADTAEGHGLVATGAVGDLALDGGQSAALAVVRKEVRAMLGRPDVDSVLVSLLPALGLAQEALIAELAALSATSAKPLLTVLPGNADPAQRVTGILGVDGDRTGGLPCFENHAAALSALAALAEYVLWRSEENGVVEEPPSLTSAAERRRAEELLAAWLRPVHDEGLLALDHEQMVELLSCYGITVLPSRPFGTVAEAQAAAEELGWPVALKTQDPILRHRLDLGGVRLNIQDAESLERNIHQMRYVLADYGAGELEVQSMAGVGQACTVRAIEDPLLGPVVAYGLAGDAVKILDDWAYRVPPLSPVQALDFVHAPRAAVKLGGYEGLPGVDTQALADLLLRVAELKDRHPEVALLEFTPVLVGRRGLNVLSATVHIADAQQRTDSARRALRN